ncbi:MAG: CHAT domain-containing protein [Acidobacteriia bacterium]|nr:CHAT domain-containing protein [Terriglobia bacterium]
MITIKLTIEGSGQGELCVHYWDSKGGNSSNRPYVLTDTQLTKLTVKRLHRFVAGNWGSSKCEREDLQILGLHLYHMLFDKHLRELYDVALRKLKGEEGADGGSQLRLKLIFSEKASELAMLPFEYVFMPNATNATDGEFLAHEAELILVRHVGDAPEMGAVKPVPVLRVLIIKCAPRHLGDIETTIPEYINKLQSQYPKQILARILPNPTLEDVRKTIQGDEEKGELPFEPDIFHFIGHGQPETIAFCKDKKTIEHDFEEAKKNLPREAANRLKEESIDDSDWHKAETVAGLFPKKKPRAVLLTACSSAAQGFRDLEITSSFAQGLVREKIPAVIAMQYRISHEDADSFATDFYTQIVLQSNHIDEAVKKGVMGLGKKAPSWNHPRFGIPVLFLQAEDVSFLDSVPVPVSKSATEGNGKTVSKELACPACNTRVFPAMRVCPNNGCGLRLKDCKSCGGKISKDANHCCWCIPEEIKAPEAQPQSATASFAGSASITSRAPVFAAQPIASAGTEATRPLDTRLTRPEPYSPA